MDDLRDYCAACVADHGCARLDVLTAPDAIHWDGGGGLTAFYECDCGHTWRCSWSARGWLGTETGAA